MTQSCLPVAENAKRDQEVPLKVTGVELHLAEARLTLWDIRRATRWHHSAEEKIRIALEGLRGEVSIAELCRRADQCSGVERDRRHCPRNGQQLASTRGCRRASVRGYADM